MSPVRPSPAADMVVQRAYRKIMSTATHDGHSTRVSEAMSGTPNTSPERVVSPPKATSKRRTAARLALQTDGPYVQAIRKKIEGELARKRTISTTNQHQSSRRRANKANVQKGTVAALKPSPALTVPENITVSEASQLCAAKRTDCVLVVDDDEGLSGIFTAKDLAYRVCAHLLKERRYRGLILHT